MTKSHYERNKEKYKKGNLERRERNKLYVFSIKEKSKCMDCGVSDPRVLDFDHVRGEKIKTIARASWDGWSINKIDEEIAKCDVRCANCHRIKTFY